MTVNVYRERSSDETDSDDENEEELRTFSEKDEFLEKRQSNSRGIDDNDEDEKEQLVIRIRQVVIEIRTNTKLDN